MLGVEYVCAWGSRVCLKVKGKSDIQETCLINLDTEGKAGQICFERCPKVGKRVGLCFVRAE